MVLRWQLAALEFHPSLESPEAETFRNLSGLDTFWQAVGESHSDSHAVSPREAASDGGRPRTGKLRVRGGQASRRPGAEISQLSRYQPARGRKGAHGEVSGR